MLVFMQLVHKNVWKLEMGLFSLRKRRLRGNRMNAYKFLMGERQVNEARLFLLMASDRTRSDGHELVHRKLYANMRKNFSCEGD